MTGRVFAVASGKGGVGKTTTAVNLAAAATEAGRSVVLVDYDLGMANLGDVLDVEASTPTLHDVLAGDADALDATREAPGGFDVMLGGTDIEDFGRADPAELRGVVDALRDEYETVIVDTGGGLTHDTTVPLGVADDVVLVSTPTAAALGNTGKTSDLVGRLDGAVRGIVFTRVGAGGQVDTSNAENDLGMDVLGAIPEDRSVPESAAAGEPVVEHAPDSPSGQSYRELGHELLGESMPLSSRDGADEANEVDDTDEKSEENEVNDADEESETSGTSETSTESKENGEREEGQESGKNEKREAEPVGDAIVGTLDESDGGEGEDGSDGGRSLVSKLTGGLLG